MGCIDPDSVVQKLKIPSVKIKIHHNIFHDYQGSSGNAAVQPVHASGSVSVYNNVLWNVGSIKMGTTSNNIINPFDKSVSSWMVKRYGSLI